MRGVRVGEGPPLLLWGCAPCAGTCAHVCMRRAGHTAEHSAYSLCAHQAACTTTGRGEVCVQGRGGGDNQETCCQEDCELPLSFPLCAGRLATAPESAPGLHEPCVGASRCRAVRSTWHPLCIVDGLRPTGGYKPRHVHRPHGARHGQMACCPAGLTGCTS